MSKITIGGLKDLGWNVNFNLAENYEPCKHVIRYSNEIRNGTPITMLSINKHNFRSYDGNRGFKTYHEFLPDIPGFAGQDRIAYYYVRHLRRGIEYTFIDETGDGITLYDHNGLPLTEGITNITNGVKWAIPSNYPISNPAGSPGFPINFTNIELDSNVNGWHSGGRAGLFLQVI
jgi:hypothetical protein